MHACLTVQDWIAILSQPEGAWSQETSDAPEVIDRWIDSHAEEYEAYLTAVRLEPGPGGEIEAELQARDWVRDRLGLEISEAPGESEAFDCPTCMATYRELEERMDALEHFDPAVVLEEAEADRELALLEPLGPAQRVAAIRLRPEVGKWALCMRLLQESRRQWLDDPREAHGWALASVAAASALDEEVYQERWVADMRARACAHLANTFRIMAQFDEADRWFHHAETWLAQGTGGEMAEVQVLGLELSFLVDLHRYDQAEMLLSRLKTLHKRQENYEAQGRLLMQQARIQYLADNLTEAARSTREALAAFEQVTGDVEDLRLLAQQNLVMFLAELGEVREARHLYERLPPVLDHALATRRNWVEANLLREEDRLEQACAVYEDVRASYASSELHYDAAIVTLDMALAALKMGDAETVNRLTEDVAYLLASSATKFERLAPTLLLQQALENRAISETLLRQVAKTILRHRPA